MKIDRKKILLRFNGHCAYCGCKLEKMHIDHVIPQREFEYFIKNQRHIPEFLKHLTVSDVNHEDNLFPACSVCNLWKSAHSLEQFRFELGEQIKRLNQRSANYRIAKKYGQIKEAETIIVFYFETFAKTTFTPIDKT